MSDITQDDPGTISLWAELKASLGDLTKAVQQRNKLEASRAVQPSYNEIHGSVILNANGYGVIRFDLQGPNQGFVWNVKTLAVGGQTPAIVVVGRADVYILAHDITSTQQLSDVGLQGWRDTTTSLPGVSTYGEGQMFCHSMEELWVIVSGGTANQQVNAIALIQNVQEAANKQVTGL